MCVRANEKDKNTDEECSLGPRNGFFVALYMCNSFIAYCSFVDLSLYSVTLVYGELIIPE